MAWRSERAVDRWHAQRRRAPSIWTSIDSPRETFAGPRHASLIAFITSAERAAFEVFALEPRHLGRVRSLMEKYRDLPMDLADASLVVLAEELGSGEILSTDTRDFRTYRWKNRKPFRNLLAV